MSRLIPHSEDRFKFDPTAKEVEPPDIESIKLDPDNQLSEETREKFRLINLRYKDLFTTTPGRYSGFFGDVDTSLQFTQTPVQTRKVSQLGYNREMNEELGKKMDELIRGGIFMTLRRSELLSSIFLRHNWCLSLSPTPTGLSPTLPA